MIQIKRKLGKYTYILKQNGSGKTKKHKLIRVTGKGAMTANINATTFNLLRESDTESWADIFIEKKKSGTLKSKRMPSKYER